MTDSAAATVYVRLAIPSGSQIDAGQIGLLADQLRVDLVACGVEDVALTSTDAAPEDARPIDVAAAVAMVVNVAGGVASVVTIVEYLRRWRRRDQERGHLMLAVDASNAANVPGARSALIIANAVYEDKALRRLRAPGQDAQALAAVLGDPSVGGFDVHVLADGTEGQVRRRVAAFFADRDHDDVLVVHFSCHGIKDSRGRLYLAARDTELGSFAATAVPASFVAEQMSETGSQRVVLMLDCCYSGAFNAGALVRGDRAVHPNDEFGGGTGRIVLTASTATEYAFEAAHVAESHPQPSVFTRSLVEGLRSGAADLDGDGKITADELYSYTMRRVRQTRSDQRPMKWVYGLSDSVVIARSVRGVVFPQRISADLASDRVVLRLEAVAALAGMLTDDREGLRTAARRALGELSSGDDDETVREAATRALSAAPPIVPSAAPATTEDTHANPAVDVADSAAGDAHEQSADDGTGGQSADVTASDVVIEPAEPTAHDRARKTSRRRPSPRGVLRVSVALLCLILVAGVATVYFFFSRPVWLGLHGDQVAVFRGRPGDAANLPRNTGVARAQVPPSFRPVLENGVPVDGTDDGLRLARLLPTLYELDHVESAYDEGDGQLTPVGSCGADPCDGAHHQLLYAVVRTPFTVHPGHEALRTFARETCATRLDRIAAKLAPVTRSETEEPTNEAANIVHDFGYYQARWPARWIDGKHTIGCRFDSDGRWTLNGPFPNGLLEHRADGAQQLSVREPDRFNAFDLKAPFQAANVRAVIVASFNYPQNATYGVACRHDAQADSLYVMRVNAAGRYFIKKRIAGVWQPDLAAGPVTNVGTGQHTLIVACNTAEDGRSVSLELALDGHTVGTAVDSTDPLLSGDVALYMNDINTTPTVTATFTDLAVVMASRHLDLHTGR